MRHSEPGIDHFTTETAQLPAAQPSEWVDVAHGDHVHLRIAPVTKQLGDATVRMLAYNGSIPGPTLRVREGTKLLVSVVNEGDLETTVHWHGLRLDNRYDGTTETQRPIPIGGTFEYEISFPDPGVYWYHPHIREDYGQEMGLYGNILVVPSESDYWSPVNRELTLTLDDILLEDGKIAPFNTSYPTYTAMGRFGNVLLVNGNPDLALQVKRGELVRFFLTNTANSRVFNVSFVGAQMKLVGGDGGRYERESFVDSVLLAPSERAVVDVLFDRAGQVILEHTTPAGSYNLASITVAPDAIDTSFASEFTTLRTSADITAERARVASFLMAEPEKTLALVAEMDMGEAHTSGNTVTAYMCPMHPEVTGLQPDRCPKCGMKLVPSDLVVRHGHSGGHERVSAQHAGHLNRGGLSSSIPNIEWEDDMIEVNRMTNPTNMRWKLIDRSTGAEGAAIDWRFRVGDRAKIRLINEIDSDHPMHHPFHVHGAGRFLILSRDGIVERNLVWKDTVLVPTGQTVDILLDVTHPGVWMAHCHIAEHHESGMMLRFSVD